MNDDDNWYMAETGTCPICVRNAILGPVQAERQRQENDYIDLYLSHTHQAAAALLMNPFDILTLAMPLTLALKGPLLWFPWH